MKFGIGALVSFGPHWERQTGTVVDIYNNGDDSMCGVRIQGTNQVIDIPRFALTQIL